MNINLNKLLLSFLLFTFISNTTFAAVPNEGKESREISYSAGKLGIKTKEGIKKLAGFKQQKHAMEGASDAAKHELYKKQLRQSMTKPKVSNPELKEIANFNYRPRAEIGSGSTADALRFEKSTGQLVKGSKHDVKARSEVNRIRKWLDKNPNASSNDKSAAEQMMLDMMEALGDI